MKNCSTKWKLQYSLGDSALPADFGFRFADSEAISAHFLLQFGGRHGGRVTKSPENGLLYHYI
jgi:hypothetical protein